MVIFLPPLVHWLGSFVHVSTHTRKIAIYKQASPYRYGTHTRMTIIPTPYAYIHKNLMVDAYINEGLIVDTCHTIPAIIFA